MQDSVVVVGDIMTDIVVKPHGLPAPGTDQPATITPLPGGSAANQAVWLATHGLSVRLVARVAAGDRPWQADQFRDALAQPGPHVIEAMVPTLF